MLGENKRILVVDDDPDIVEPLRMVLESANCDVGSASSAQEALERTQACQPSLILLDIMMPNGTEGFHFVWKLRNEYPEPVSQTPILILTAIHSTTLLRIYPDWTDGEYGPGEFLPVQGFTDKPIKTDELRAKIEAVLK